MARYLYSELASLVQARRNCAQSMERLNPNEVSAHVPMYENQWHQAQEWFDKHEEAILFLVSEHMPSGSGFDNGTKIDLDASHGEKLVFTTSYHHMNDVGYYDGWTEHTVTVTPSFNGFNIRVSGRNRNDVKERIQDLFDYALMTEVIISHLLYA